MFKELEEIRGEKIIPIGKHLKRIPGVKRKSVQESYRDARFRLNRRVTASDVIEAARALGLEVEKHGFYFNVTLPGKPRYREELYVETGVSPLMVVDEHRRILDPASSAILGVIRELSRRTKKPKLTERFGKWWTRERQYKELMAGLRKVPGVKEGKQTVPYEIRLSFNRRITPEAVRRAAQSAGLTAEASEDPERQWHAIFGSPGDYDKYRTFISLAPSGMPVYIRRTWAFGEQLDQQRKEQILRFFEELARSTTGI